MSDEDTSAPESGITRAWTGPPIWTAKTATWFNEQSRGRQQIDIERLRSAILDWWASRRPVGWDAKQHAAYPLVNIGPSDERLALIAAEIEMGVMR